MTLMCSSKAGCSAGGSAEHPLQGRDPFACVTQATDNLCQNTILGYTAGNTALSVGMAQRSVPMEDWKEKANQRSISYLNTTFIKFGCFEASD